jgi:carboxypeptidase T
LKLRFPISRFLTLVAGLALLGTAGLPAPGSATLAHPQASAARGPAPLIQAEEQGVVARVYFTGLDDLNHLAAYLDVWEVYHDQGYLVALLSPAESTGLERAGYRIVIDAARTAELSGVRPALPGQVSGIPGYPCYRTVEETQDTLARLAETYPHLARRVDIGDSWEKVTPGGSAGYDLYTLVLTNEAIPGPKPAFFLMGAIHAREYATAELATRFAEELLDGYGDDPDATWLLDYYEVHILPQANPDGRKIAEGGVWWRKNVDRDDGCSDSRYWGTDLNRNSSFKWGEPGASSDPCSETYRGPGPASEPETQAIQDYVAALYPDQRGPEDGDPAPADAQGVFITLHSYWPLVLFPWGWGPQPAPNHTQLETLGRKFGFFTGYPVCQSGEPECIYLTSGTTDDWAYGEFGVAAYTFEVGTNFFQSCSDFEGAVLPENLPALRYAFKAARRPYLDPSGPETVGVSLSAGTLVPGVPAVLHALADDTRYSSGGWGNEPVQAIAAARYSIDAPSWVEGTPTYPLEAADGAFDNPVEDVQATIDTSNLAEGRHMIFVESQDASGNWGVPGAIFLYVESRDYLPGLSPETVEVVADPGEVVTYNFQVSNLGLKADSYQIEISGYSWKTDWEPAATGRLESGASQALVLSVTVPPDAPGGNSDTAQIRVISQGEPSRSAAASAITTVRRPYDLSLSPATAAQSARLGSSLMYTLLVTNTGRFKDTYTVSLGEHDWDTEAQLPIAEVDRGGTVALFVFVSIPEKAAEHGSDAVEVLVTSQNDPGMSRSATLTTSARWFNLFFPLAGR